MCLPGTVETVRARADAEGVRVDRRSVLLAGAGAALAAALPRGAQAARAHGPRLQDLTHVFRDDLPMFPGAPRPERDTFVTIPANGYYGQVWTIWEHTGTHMDAPGHFVAGGRHTPELRVEELVAPIVVVDISARAAAEPDTVLTRADLVAFERRHGRIPRGALVCMHSGWDARVGDEAAYRNMDASGTMRFPGFDADAVDWLVARRDIAGIGVDTLSLDHGPSSTFSAHFAALAADRYGLENLANLSRIPPRGATATVGVIPWQDGSGGPCRVLASW